MTLKSKKTKCVELKLTKADIGRTVIVHSKYRHESGVIINKKTITGVGHVNIVVNGVSKRIHNSSQFCIVLSSGNFGETDTIYFSEEDVAREIILTDLKKKLMEKFKYSTITEIPLNSLKEINEIINRT